MSIKPTAKDVLKKIEALKLKVTALSSSSVTFQGTAVDQGLAVHSAALLVKQTIENITPDVVNVQRPVPIADATQIVKVVKEIQADTNTAANQLISKKGLFEGLGAANLAALIRQDIKEVHAAFTALANGLVNIAPAEIVEQAKVIRKEYDETIKKALAVYQ